MSPHEHHLHWKKMKRCLNCERLMDQVHSCVNCGEQIPFECDCDSLRAELEQLRQALHDARIENSGQAAELERRWISVKERLPEPKIAVLVAKKNGLYSVQWIYNGKWSTGATVTHWMPIPSTPTQTMNKTTPFCPFCGSTELELSYFDDRNHDWAQVHCDGCGACGPAVPAGSAEDAWGRFVPLPDRGEQTVDRGE